MCMKVQEIFTNASVQSSEQTLARHGELDDFRAKRRHLTKHLTDKQVRNTLTNLFMTVVTGPCFSSDMICVVFSEHQGCFCRQCTSDLEAVHTSWRLMGCDGVVAIHFIVPLMLNFVSGAVITGENSEAWTTYHREGRNYISVRLTTTQDQSTRGTA